MAGKIGRKARKGSRNHGQQTGGRRTGYLNRGPNRDIDAAVDEAQTGRKPRERRK